MKGSEPLKIYRDIPSLSNQIPKTAVALGLFDGVHLGHRAVIGAVVQQKKHGLTPAVFTFSTHQSTPSSKGSLSYICTDTDRLSILESLGVEIVFMPDFEDIKDQSAYDFVHDILKCRFNAGFVSCGFNFHFGAKGVGNIDILQNECLSSGIALHITDPMTYGGDPISSSRIRNLLLEGKIEQANILLGAPYFISGEVIHGFSVGHEIGFPTANQAIQPNRIVPRHGVYATLTEIDGKTYHSVTNIGLKPTIAKIDSPLSETHIIGYDGDLYGKNIKVIFRSFLRPEQKFSGLDALKDQIARDKQCSLDF